VFEIKLLLAGLGHIIAHWSIGLIIIAACLVIEFAAGWLIAYMPLLAKPIAWLQKYVLFVAVGTALVLFGEWLGAIDLAARCDAKAAVVNSEVKKQVDKAKANPGRDQFDSDQ
jgi:hypothetical protein